MTCKKCYHCDVCSEKDGTTNFYGKELACSDVEKRCQYFKDKLLIAELPCKVGETLYCISYNDNFIKEYKNINLVNILILMAALENPASRIVLLTGNKKEAETKLKEINKND